MLGRVVQYRKSQTYDSESEHQLNPNSQLSFHRKIAGCAALIQPIKSPGATQCGCPLQLQNMRALVPQPNIG